MSMYNNANAGYAPACYGCKWREGFGCRLDFPRLADDGETCKDKQEPPRRRRENRYET